MIDLPTKNNPPPQVTTNVGDKFLITRQDSPWSGLVGRANRVEVLGRGYWKPGETDGTTYEKLPHTGSVDNRVGIIHEDFTQSYTDSEGFFFRRDIVLVAKDGYAEISDALRRLYEDCHLLDYERRALKREYNNIHIKNVSCYFEDDRLVREVVLYTGGEFNTRTHLFPSHVKFRPDQQLKGMKVKPYIVDEI